MACKGCDQRGFKLEPLNYAGRCEELVLPCYDCNDNPRYFAELERRSIGVIIEPNGPGAQIIRFPLRKREPRTAGPETA